MNSNNNNGLSTIDKFYHEIITKNKNEIEHIN